MLLSKKFSSGKKKCFTGYLYRDYKIKLLHIMLPKASVYLNSYDGQTRYMHFLIKDDGFLE